MPQKSPPFSEAAAKSGQRSGGGGRRSTWSPQVPRPDSPGRGWWPWRVEAPRRNDTVHPAELKSPSPALKSSQLHKAAYCGGFRRFWGHKSLRKKATRPSNIWVMEPQLQGSPWAAIVLAQGLGEDISSALVQCLWGLILGPNTTVSSPSAVTFDSPPKHSNAN